MGLIDWCIAFGISTLFAYWVVYKGGASWFEGWLFGWSEETIRFYYGVLWLISLIVFVIGLFSESVRGLGGFFL